MLRRDPQYEQLLSRVESLDTTQLSRLVIVAQFFGIEFDQAEKKEMGLD